MTPGKAPAHTLRREGCLQYHTTSRALYTSNVLSPSPEAGVYKAHKNLKSLPRVHGIYFKETPARKRILQICRLKVTFSAAPAYCTLHRALVLQVRLLPNPKVRLTKALGDFHAARHATLDYLFLNKLHTECPYWPLTGQASPSSAQRLSSAPSATSHHGANPKEGMMRAGQPHTRHTHRRSQFHKENRSQDPCWQPIRIFISTCVPG